MQSTLQRRHRQGIAGLNGRHPRRAIDDVDEPGSFVSGLEINPSGAVRPLWGAPWSAETRKALWPTAVVSSQPRCPTRPPRHQRPSRRRQGLRRARKRVTRPRKRERKARERARSALRRREHSYDNNLDTHRLNIPLPPAARDAVAVDPPMPTRKTVIPRRIFGAVNSPRNRINLSSA